MGWVLALQTSLMYVLVAPTLPFTNPQTPRTTRARGNVGANPKRMAQMTMQVKLVRKHFRLPNRSEYHPQKRFPGMPPRLYAAVRYPE